jgi:hypothetical protein
MPDNSDKSEAALKAGLRELTASVRRLREELHGELRGAATRAPTPTDALRGAAMDRPSKRQLRRRTK